MRRVGLVVLVVLLSFATPALAQTSQSVTVGRVVDATEVIASSEKVPARSSDKK
jgi:hypothetical protein